MLKITLAALCLVTLAATTVSGAIVVQVVDVFNVGNPNDPLDGDSRTAGIQNFGAVATPYAIGKYEVTLTEYVEFLNAVAVTDTYGLYSTSMATNLNIAGISRSGAVGSYSYSVIGSGNRPVTLVTWFDAARFTNWLHNGQPTGAQNASTTEDGAYSLLGAMGGVSFTKKAEARYWIPSENEWYKAAHYQPAAAGGDTDGYWLYPTRSNAIPNSRNGSTTDANSANFLRDDAIANGFNGGFAVTNSPTRTTTENYLTDAGAFTVAGSYYGTFDQGGSVYEWNDAVITGGLRGLRGGAFGTPEINMRTSDRSDFGDPAAGFDFIGFRIATIPEPTVAVTVVLGFAMLVSRRKRVF